MSIPKSKKKKEFVFTANNGILEILYKINNQDVKHIKIERDNIVNFLAYYYHNTGYTKTKYEFKLSDGSTIFFEEYIGNDDDVLNEISQIGIMPMNFLNFIRKNK